MYLYTYTKRYIHYIFECMLYFTIEVFFFFLSKGMVTSKINDTSKNFQQYGKVLIKLNEKSRT